MPTVLRFDYFHGEHAISNTIKARRERMAKDLAFAKGRATFSVLQSESEPTLVAFVYDHECSRGAAMQVLMKNLGLHWYRERIMPFYPPVLAG